jgi:hypothetical protein
MHSTIESRIQTPHVPLGLEVIDKMDVVLYCRVFW